VSGKITFDRIPFDSVLGSGLNPNAAVESPARGIVVEAINGTSVVATAITNASGDYSLSVPSNAQLFIRAKAQMLKTGSAPTWNFRVLNNVNGDALYVLDGSTFNSGAANSTRNLRAASGWNGTSYANARAAAPFAILDTIYQAAGLVASVAPTSAFEPLNLFWSPSNRAGTVDPNGNAIICIDQGDIQTTSYVSGQDTDHCNGQILPGIYVLGAFEQGSGPNVSADTDEFDQHVLAHEFGHYIEDKFSRSDSIGGDHFDGAKLDLRLAFGEGWGNAFAGMVLNDPVYRDSFGGMASDFHIDLEQDDTNFGDGGWYSETSVGEILWDLFDATNESGDAITLGFGPIFQALSDGQRTTPALTSIFSFLEALRNAVPGQSAAINQLRNGEQISGTDEFGSGETNNGGDASTLPIYQPVLLNGGQQRVCVRGTNGEVNKLGNRKFFRLDLANPALVSISVVSAVDPGTPGSTAAEDPDIYVHRQGQIIAFGLNTGASETITQTSFPAGTYIIEVLDFELTTGDPPRCMTVNVQGA